MSKYIPSEEALKFVAKAIDKYGGKYDYSKVVYVNSKEKVLIICPIHGEFWQTPNQHLKKTGVGCTQCGIDQKHILKRYTTEQFIKKASVKHNSTYDYSNVVYSHNSDKIEIICPVHGKFKQTAYTHLYGQGCSKCGREKTTQAKRGNPDKNGWSYSNWKKAGEKSSDFDRFKLYIIECSGEGEYFTKIGKTFTTVGKRFYGSRLPYTWNVVKIVEGSAEYISSLEEELHRNLKEADQAYKPSKTFDGSNECYKYFYKDIM